MKHHVRELLSAVLVTAVATRIYAPGAAVGHVTAGPVYGGTVHVAFTGDATTLDTTQSFEEDWWLINGTLFNGLYRLDRNALPQLDLAAALVKASGYHGRPLVLLYNTSNARNTSVAPGIQQDLQQIGIKVTLRGANGSTVHALQQSLTGAQLSFNGWSADFPDGYDYYSGTMSCGANADGGSGPAHYCDPAADKLVARAESLPLGDARNALLRQAQIRILRAAVQVPLDYPLSTEVVSPQVQGFYYQPLFGWQYENYWLQQ